MESLFSLAVLGIFFAVFYFLIMRPQKKRQQAHQDLVRSLARGDRVVTAGGICGEIKKVNDDTIILESEEGTVLKLRKHSIVERE